MTTASDVRNFRSIITLIVFIFTNVVVVNLPISISYPWRYCVQKYLVNLRILSAPHHVDTNEESLAISDQPPKELSKFPVNPATAWVISVLFLLACTTIRRQEVHDGIFGSDGILHYLGIHRDFFRPQTPAQGPASADPPSTSHPAVEGHPSRMDNFMAVAGDDGDDDCGAIELKWKPANILRRSQTTTVQIVKTHQKFVLIENTNAYKWAALLGFRLEIRGANPAKLELTGNLQDPALCREGILEISNVWPYRPTGDHSEPSTVQRSESNTVTLTGRTSGLHPIPGFSLAVAAESTKSWSEAHRVVRTQFSNRSPRQTLR